MTNRDRLIELINEAKKEYESIVTDYTETDYIVAVLLNKGVIVPPCKVGDTIYKINKIPNSACGPFITKEKVEPYAVFYKNIMGGYSCIPFESFNETVFLLEEKAEEKLEEIKHG